MGGKHIVRISLNTPRITLIPFKSIEVSQMPACAIHEKAEKLVKDLRDILTLATSSDLPKKRFQARVQNNAAQISYKQTQSCSAGPGATG